MGIWGTIFGAGIKEPIEAIGNVIDELHTSKEEKLTHQQLMERLRQRPMLAQMAVNKVEAQHRSIFVAGWRPAAGWVCVAALAYMWLLRVILNDAFGMAGYPLPDLDVSVAEVMGILTPMLGLGAYRTAEKMAGRAK